MPQVTTVAVGYLSQIDSKNDSVSIDITYSGTGHTDVNSELTGKFSLLEDTIQATEIEKTSTVLFSTRC